MLKRLAILLLALLVPLAAATAALAQAPENLAEQTMEGVWDFRIEGVTIFRFEIEQGEGEEWLGQWQRPTVFNTDGNNFANLGGGVKSDPSMTGIEFLGHVELSFEDARPGAVPDIFRFELQEDDRAEMLYVGTDLEPYILVRAGADDAIGDWESGTIYRRFSRRAAPQEEVAPVEAPIEAPLEAPVEAAVRSPRSGQGINFIEVNPVELPEDIEAPQVEDPLSEEAPEVLEEVAELDEAEAEADEVGADEAGVDESGVDEPEEAAESLLGDDFLDGL